MIDLDNLKATAERVIVHEARIAQQGGTIDPQRLTLARGVLRMASRVVAAANVVAIAREVEPNARELNDAIRAYDDACFEVP